MKKFNLKYIERYETEIEIEAENLEEAEEEAYQQITNSKWYENGNWDLIDTTLKSYHIN